MNEEIKIMYGLIALLVASGLLTYLTRNSNPAPGNEPVREKKQNKKRQPKPELQLLRDQNMSHVQEEGTQTHTPATEHHEEQPTA
jgi:hypothetical protein